MLQVDWSSFKPELDRTAAAAEFSDQRCYVEFEDSTTFDGYIVLNPHTGELCFDNDSGCESVSSKKISRIRFCLA